MAAEQFFNVKLLVEQVGVRVEVARGITCEVKNEEVAAKIELVTSDSEKGKEMIESAIKKYDVEEVNAENQKITEGSKTCSQASSNG
ncbi:hypothetical protein GOBAR_AA03062 [Gossypium barbadense]|uniref:Uncharacterized protein n=1 Tax=Gossypium barbadense TaxID=3634 RepID=A0A2P5YPL6_GOSBA|nr:hypothetical protein GOBAR_AA03062 [Gossypium barbadense]